jgi:16S rRNA (cytosine1402-N4)-methyltransferase
MSTSSTLHIPVMLKEVLEYMAPEDNKIYVDGTFGAGGYSSALLEDKDCIVYAIDRDPDVIMIAQEKSKKYQGRLRFLQGCFGNMEELLAAHQINQVDGIILDIGVSSMQLDNKERGFSFMHDAYLDMRMGKEGVDAYHVVNNMEEEELANIIYQFGDETKSRWIAKKIVALRKESPIKTTHQLAEIVRSVVGRSNKKIDPATKTFQAIRIWINDELNELTRALEAAESLLASGGRLIVVTFHSLEDVIVKKFMAKKSGKVDSVSRYMPANQDKVVPSFNILTKNAVKPSDEEIRKNPRARSAKLRAAEKIAGVKW